MSKLSYNIKEAVEATGISRASLYRDIQAGLLKIKKRGNATVIMADDLNSYLAGLPDAEAA